MASRWRAILLFLVACWVLVIPGLGAEPSPPRIQADLVLRGGILIDGTGDRSRAGDLAIRGDRIVAVGSFSALPATPELDVSGLCVAPGFIDLHTHSDDGIVQDWTRLNLNYLTQGVTTIVTGNCGSGPIDVERFLARVDGCGAGTNVLHLVPLGSLRRAVLGLEDRPASASELERMRSLVARGLRAGAWGVSSGLIYVPGRFAGTNELIELARVVGEHGGIYASHIRNEEDRLLESLAEAIAIGKAASVPVHISHLKANGPENWGRAASALSLIEAARGAGELVTADQYPYVASSTSLGAMVVPPDAVSRHGAEFQALLDDPHRGPALRAEIQRALDRRGGGAAIRIVRDLGRPGWVGRDLASIARLESTTPLEIVLDIQRRGGAQAIHFGMDEGDVREIMRREYVATASDGAAHRPGAGDRPHPRSYGTFPRKLRYALREGVITLEQAVRSATGLPAAILGLPERGTLRPGNFADLVVFHAPTLLDTATFERPTEYARGIEHLFVNGVAVIARGKPVFQPMTKAKLPGRALRFGSDGPADLIVCVGRIWTGWSERPWADGVAARGGVVVEVGPREDVMRFRGPKTRVVELPNAFAMPGLIDAHGHVESLGASRELVDLRGVGSLEEVVRRVRERIEAVPGDSWILGVNWDQSLWEGGEFPTASVLDAAAPSRPVWLTRVDGHAGWANSEAMRRAGVTAATEAPPDGQILRDREGNPTGVFIDGAKGLVARVIPPPTRDDLKRRILAAQEAILAAGLTSVHDAGVSALEAEVYRELDRSGALVVRIYAMALPPDGKEVEFVSRPPPPAEAGSRFQLRAIKLFIDGAMGSRGGLLFEPYHDDPTNRGLLLLDPKVLEATTRAALANGWQVATHAIGDRGNALVLDAYEAALKDHPPTRDPRLRIEHAQVVRRQDVARFAKLGIIASMQPSHASDDMRWAEARLGPERVAGAYAWRWFVDADVRLAFGSDFPVEIVEPFWGIYAALTRADERGHPPGGWHPEHCLTLEETLRAFTAGAAYAAFLEDELGILKPGMRADLTIVDRDLFRVSAAELLRSQVQATIIEGRVVYERRGP